MWVLVVMSIFLLAPSSVTGGPFSLPIRDLDLAVDPHEYDAETDNAYLTDAIEIDPSKTALIIIDPWETHPNDGWTERAGDNMRDYLKPLIDRARALSIRIVYAPSNQPISPIVAPEPGDTVISTPGSNTDDVALDAKLTEWGVDTLLYAGYAANICVIDKPAGARDMFKRDRTRRFILVRDATIGYEMPSTLDGEWLKKGAIFTFEYYYGVSTTVAEFLDATSP